MRVKIKGSFFFLYKHLRRKKKEAKLNQYIYQNVINGRINI